MTATQGNPLVVDLTEPFGYVVHHWPSQYTKEGQEPLVIDFRLFSPYEREIWDCEFSIKWDGCANLSMNDGYAMHFCSQEGVRRFAAVLLKCFELAAALMPTHAEEFLSDGHHDDEQVIACFARKP